MAVMRKTAAPLVLLAIALAALAGFVDAYAFTRLGAFFVSFMSGNTTRGGVALGTGDWETVRTAGTLVMAFVSGVMLAVIAGEAAGRMRMAAAMGLATLFLAAAALAAPFWPPLVLPLLAAAMGAENGVFARDGEVSIGVTYFTGNLVRLGQGLATALMGGRPRWTWLRYLALWLGFVGGVVGGAMAEVRIGDHALWYAMLAAGWLTLLLGLAGGRSRA
jgi:uncharacterized membrane protein YoaK (UPF0700 family)